MGVIWNGCCYHLNMIMIDKWFGAYETQLSHQKKAIQAHYAVRSTTDRSHYDRMFEKYNHTRRMRTAIRPTSCKPFW